MFWIDGLEVEESRLTSGQKKALADMEAGENVFLTGDAGTGKSLLLKYFMAKNADKRIVPCAPTGIAALNLENGCTVHRTFELPFRPLYRASEYNPPSEAVCVADTVILDEVSMCRVDLFHQVAKAIYSTHRNRAAGDHPQLILVGDFFQLPPVVRRDSEEATLLAKDFPKYRNGFAFEDWDMWDTFGFKTHVLTEVKRQGGGEAGDEFKKMLTKARYGDPSCVPYFNERVGAKVSKDAIRLVPTNNKAKAYNEMRLVRGSSGPIVEFRAKTEGEVFPSDKPLDDVLKFAVGARVMMAVNDPDWVYQNGSMGTVVQLNSKSAVVDLDNGGIVEVCPHQWEIRKPVVRETSVRGELQKEVEYEVVGSFTQMPMKLAYAITIHKSQGQTLDQAVVDPAVFSEGMLYVALSRVRSYDGLSLTAPIKPKVLRASAEALRFHQGGNG